MLKARPAADDLDLGQDFVDMVSPMVWQAAERENFVSDTQAMRKRVIEHIPAKEASRELKLGRGGLRDVEFSVQLLQLVHGRVDERLREPRDPARAEGAGRPRVRRPRGRQEPRTVVPLPAHARAPGAAVQPAAYPSAAGGARTICAGSDARWATPIRRTGSSRPGAPAPSGSGRCTSGVFYSPAARRGGPDPQTSELRLTTDAAQDRLRALGYADPKAALRHIAALSQGVTRSAEIQRQLLPAMLGWFAAGPNPDAGLLAFRQVSEALGNTPWYLRALRDEGMMAERLARILASSRYAVSLLTRAPQTVQMLADDKELEPRSLADLEVEMHAAAGRHEHSDRSRRGDSSHPPARALPGGRR